MKTGLDMINDAFSVLNVPALTAEINGRLLKLERPKNSQLEDVVINALPLTNTQLQAGIFNVNIHVPNLQLTVDGTPDETQPNVPRLNQLTNIVIGLISAVYGYDYHFIVQNSPQPIKDKDNNWYMNIRVAYYSVQENFN